VFGHSALGFGANMEVQQLRKMLDAELHHTPYVYHVVLRSDHVLSLLPKP
jgi:hypothetical protein